MSYLVIVVESSDSSDLEWLKDKCIPAVENVIDEQVDEGRIDGTVPEVWWNLIDRLSELDGV